MSLTSWSVLKPMCNSVSNLFLRTTKTTLNFWKRGNQATLNIYRTLWVSPSQRHLTLKPLVFFKRYLYGYSGHGKGSGLRKRCLLGRWPWLIAREVSLRSCLPPTRYPLQLPQTYQGLLHEAKHRWKDSCGLWCVGSWSRWGDRWVPEGGKARCDWVKDQGTRPSNWKLLVVLGFEKTWHSSSWRFRTWIWKIGDDGDGNRQHQRCIMLPKDSRKCRILIIKTFISSLLRQYDYKSICVKSYTTSLSFQSSFMLQLHSNWAGWSQTTSYLEVRHLPTSMRINWWLSDRPSARLRRSTR